MKISDLIKKLEEYKKNYGDFSIGFRDDFGDFHEPIIVLGYLEADGNRRLEIQRPPEYVEVREDY